MTRATAPPLRPGVAPLSQARVGNPARLWPAAVLAVLFAVLVARSWGTWTDPLVDYGRELYVPWQMSKGATLYKDLAYFNGPLSPAVNTLWFELFGASARTLEYANLGILVVIVTLLFFLLRQIASRGAATAGCAAFLLLSAFSQFVRIRNYNFVTPYSHEMTHGFLLSLAALAAGWRVDRRGWRAAAVGGVCVGLAALTKPEMVLAAGVGFVAGLVAVSRAADASWRAVVGRLAVAAAAAVIPLVVAVAWLSRSMPLGDAVTGCTSAWRMAATPEIRALDFYRRGLGTLDLGASLEQIAVNSCRWGIAAVLAVVIVQALRRRTTRETKLAAGALGLGLGSVLWALNFPWPLLERALPVIAVVLAAWWAWKLGTERAPVEERIVWAKRLAWCAFALALLAKIALASRISHYGFVLAVPATAAIVLAAFDWLPAFARRRGLCGAAIGWFAAPLFAAYALAYQGQQSVLRDTSVQVGQGADAILAPAFAEPVAEGYRQIERQIDSNETLAVLPEGVMLNFLSGRRAPTKYITWMPPEVLFFGEANMLAALKATPPDWILLAPRELGEYGQGQFGGGFADSIAHWIESRYETAAHWNGAETIGDGGAPGDSREWRLMRRRE